MCYLLDRNVHCKYFPVDKQPIGIGKQFAKFLPGDSQFFPLAQAKKLLNSRRAVFWPMSKKMPNNLDK